MATVTITGITGFVSSLRRRIGDPSATTYTDDSLSAYLADGFNYIEEQLGLGFVTSITGSTYYVAPSPDNQGKLLATTAAEFFVKSDKAGQLIDNAILAVDGAQRIDTSKAVRAAVDMVDNAGRRLDDLILEMKHNGVIASGLVVNTYNEGELSTTSDGSAL
jgi:hypothetical protein